MVSSRLSALYSWKIGTPSFAYFFTFFGVTRNKILHEIFGGLIAGFAIHQNFFDLLSVEIANRPFYKVSFFINQRGRR